MARSKQKYHLSDRYSLDHENKLTKNEHGLIFKNEHEQKDLKDFEILHTGVDTLEQKIEGEFNHLILDSLLFNVSEGYNGQIIKTLIEYPNKHHTINGVKFRLTKANGKESGYRYQLQNKSVGMIIFFGCFHDKDWLENATMKVKLSPHLIYKEGLEACQKIVDDFASYLLIQFEYVGLEGHLCMDSQGWKPEVDFMHNVTTRSRIKRALPSAGKVSGFLDTTSLKLDSSDCGIRYDEEKSFLFGRKGSTQLAIYSKLDEAKKSNKFKFWESVYKDHIAYRENEDVYRIEARFSSSVLKNLGVPNKGGAIESYEIKSIDDFKEHIPSLWRYALLELFRYHYPDSKTVRPEWQFLADAPFLDLERKDYLYQRVKVTQSGSDTDRNIAQMLGHLSAFIAKEGISNEETETLLYNFPQRKILNDYFRQRGLNQEQWIQAFIDKVEDKRVDYGLVYESPFKRHSVHDDDYVPW